MSILSILSFLIVRQCFRYASKSWANLSTYIRYFRQKLVKGFFFLFCLFLKVKQTVVILHQNEVNANEQNTAAVVFLSWHLAFDTVSSIKSHIFIAMSNWSIIFFFKLTNSLFRVPGLHLFIVAHQRKSKTTKTILKSYTGCLQKSQPIFLPQ